MSVRTKIVGLRWMRRGATWTPYWIPPQEDVRKGFRPKSVNLKSLEQNPALLKKRCLEWQAELLTWRLGLSQDPAEFDGTIRSLVRRYQTHPGSPFHDLRPSSRRPYLHYLGKLDREIGERTVISISGLNLKQWHGAWSDGGKHLAAAATCRAVLDAIVSFGVMARLAGCSELSVSLRAMKRKLPRSPSRTATITAHEVCSLRAAAHQAGRPSSALAYAMVFETTLRLWDVIGQWLPEERWLGLRWENIGPDLVLRYVPSKTSAKTGRAVTFPLARAPMVMEELTFWSPPRSGPVIVSERTGLPYTNSYFGHAWRQDRETAGLPKHIWARDLRASGITEARAADVSLDDAGKVAGHSNTKTTSAVYDRAVLEAAERFADARAISREKKAFKLNKWGKSMNRVLIAAACATLAGCSQTPGKGDLAVIGPLPAAGIVNTHTTQTAPIVVADALPAGSTDLGAMEGTSCKNSMIDPAPTEAKALEQLKQKAADVGATGVAAVTYKRGGTSFVTNCWSTVKATSPLRYLVG